MTGFQGVTPRGFGYSEFASSDRGEKVLEVQESSLATQRCLWIGTSPDRVHLDEARVREVRDLLTRWLGEDEDEDSDERECSRCGDEVQILNSQDECMGCEEARANGDVCSRCEEDVDWEPGLGAYKEDGVTVCGSCAHNERRSS